MQEFVKKLIERLEEWSFEAEIVIPGSDGYDYTANREIICTKNAIEIVNQLAEEYNQEKIPFTQITRGNRVDIEVTSEHFENIKEVRVIDEYTEEEKVFKEYNNDFCEWRLCDEEANVYDTTCRNPHILLEGSPSDNNYEFCPYCGRKIKITPYQPKGE